MHLATHRAFRRDVALVSFLYFQTQGLGGTCAYTQTTADAQTGIILYIAVFVLDMSRHKAALGAFTAVYTEVLILDAQIVSGVVSGVSNSPFEQSEWATATRATHADGICTLGVGC